VTTAQDGGKVISFTHRPPLPTGNVPGIHFCKRMIRPQGHSATGRIMSLKNSSDTIGKRTRNLPVCSVAHQPLCHPTQMYHEYFTRGKGSRYIGLTTLPLSCADCLEIREPQPPGTLRACPGLYSDCYTYHLTEVLAQVSLWSRSRSAHGPLTVKNNIICLYLNEGLTNVPKT
jgi:hypothetical protein